MNLLFYHIVVYPTTLPFSPFHLCVFISNSGKSWLIWNVNCFYFHGCHWTFWIFSKGSVDILDFQHSHSFRLCRSTEHVFITSVWSNGLHDWDGHPEYRCPAHQYRTYSILYIKMQIMLYLTGMHTTGVWNMKTLNLKKKAENDLSI